MKTTARWVRIRAKALWLAFKVWQVTREIRETRRRIETEGLTPDIKRRITQLNAEFEAVKRA
jgi:hypothetical protein